MTSYCPDLGLMLRANILFWYVLSVYVTWYFPLTAFNIVPLLFIFCILIMICCTEAHLWTCVLWVLITLLWVSISLFSKIRTRFAIFDSVYILCFTLIFIAYGFFFLSPDCIVKYWACSFIWLWHFFDTVLHPYNFSCLVLFIGDTLYYMLYLIYWVLYINFLFDLLLKYHFSCWIFQCCCLFIYIANFLTNFANFFPSEVSRFYL